VSLTRSSAVLELGKRLVTQLDVADDFLASWMAHYIAQRIREAEDARDEAKAAATDSCAKAIVEIWEHRSSLPDHIRPLKDLEPVLRTLASLDVVQTQYRYYPEVLRESEMADADEGAQKWFELARSLDYSARLLMQFALRSAAQNAASQAAPWVDLALQAGAGYGERVVVRFILDDDDAGGTAPGEASLKDKISRLESFASLANGVATELRAQLSSEGGRD
jgi:hypothetical protein